MKILVIGAGGQLGADLCNVLCACRDFNVVPLTHAEVEIASLDSVKRQLEINKPDIVINTAAYVRVDDCEIEKDKAYLINALGARNVAVVTQQIGAKLFYFSTDYVFGGEEKPRTKPYSEFDIPVPPNVYGESKLAGENFVRNLCIRHFIVRVSGLFGVAGCSGKGGNFVETMIKLAGERSVLKVVNDQVFSPTSTRDVAQQVKRLITTDYYGIIHITNKGTCSWYEFACEIMRLITSKTRVEPITSSQYPQKARRPRYSVLDNYHLRLLGMDDMQSWQEALGYYLREKGYIQQVG